MRKFLFLIVALSSYSALAKQVELACATKAYTCSGPGGCRWVVTGTPTPVLMSMYRDPNYPNKDAPYELYRATYHSNYDSHLMTLEMEVKTIDPFQPVMVKATLDAGSVLAEASGQNEMDIALRNHSYGRGFSCTSFRTLD